MQCFLSSGVPIPFKITAVIHISKERVLPHTPCVHCGHPKYLRLNHITTALHSVSSGCIFK